MEITKHLTAARRWAVMVTLLVLGISSSRAQVVAFDDIAVGGIYVFKNVTPSIASSNLAMSWHHDGNDANPSGEDKWEQTGCRILPMDLTNENQKWEVVASNESGWYYLRNVGRNKYLKYTNDWQLQFVSSTDGPDNMKFQFVKLGDGPNFQIKGKRKGGCIGSDHPNNFSACYGDKSGEGGKTYWTALTPVVATPVIAIDYEANPMTATISCATIGATIYYTTTTNGTEPTDPTTSSTEISSGSSITYTDDTWIKAFAVVAARQTDSEIAEYSKPTVATPVVKLSVKGKVTLSCETEGVTYHYTYTTTGVAPVDPTTSDATITSGTTIPATVGQTLTVKVIAVKNHYNNSLVASASKVRKDSEPGYYAIHQNGKGYLRVSGANVSLNNDGNYHYVNLFDQGNSFWIQTEDGYLQNGYYYLNVANDQTLYLSVHPVTEWNLEVINTNGHGNLSIKYNGKYLCNDGTNIALTSDASAAHYNASPITLTETAWSGPSNNDLTVQSPQIVTYLRNYYEQTFNYEFYDDGGTRKSETGKKRRVYALQEYASGGDNKGSSWDIADGIIYNKNASGNVDVTANYNLTPCEPLVEHQTPVSKSIKLTIQQLNFAPDGAKDYLIFNLQNSTYRFLNDAEDANGYAGPGVAKGQLTDAPNTAISWKIERDADGFYSFKNVSTNKYLYFDATGYVASVTDYGTLKMGATAVPDDATKTKYKFRLFKTNNDGTFGDAWFIIPYEQQWVVYKNDGVANDINASLNVYTGGPVVSMYKPGDSRWRFYAYEWEHRLRTDWNITGPNEVSEIGTYNFETAVGYCKMIKGAPQNNQELEIHGSWDASPTTVTYAWTYTPDANDATTGNDHTEAPPTWSSNKSHFSINLTNIGASTAGTVQLTATTDASHGNLSVTKIVAFNIITPFVEPVSWTEIDELSDITSATGNYMLTVDNPSGTPGVTDFQGYLDGDGHTISGLSAPLFATVSGNGVVRNLNLSDVSISGSGNIGAIAGEANGNSRIYNIGILSGSVSGSEYTGGIIGKLDGMARVINCFSYADITGGTTVGGIVGYNNYASKSDDIRTMVMNCMFYGHITGGSRKSPVYGGQIITNDNASTTALNNYNYYAYENLKTGIDDYNCALAAEDRYLKRFEFHRNILNSNRELALWYVTGSTNAADASSKMYKWVMDFTKEGGERKYPYPILKPQGTYPSIINYDAANAPTLSDVSGENRNKGGKLGTLSVSISQGDNAPGGASIETSSLTLNITDKDFENYNFNYRKVQLPYYNQIGTGNYTSNKVVTGWEVTVSGGTTSLSTASDDATLTDGVVTSAPYNFADPKCTDKDNYASSGRIFAQGGYFNVPDGVTSISIKPHWGKAIYLSDPYYDVVYNKSYGRADVQVMGTRPTTYNGQTVYTSIDGTGGARSQLETKSTVYDQAIVLVGNYHHFSGKENAIFGSDQSKPYTVMSADLNNDNEPDYSFFFQSTDRVDCAPIRFDFLNFPGIGMAQKVSNSNAPQMPNQGIFRIKGWFEVTTTCIVRFTEFEYDYLTNKQLAPLILLGGVFEQITSNNTGEGSIERTEYIHLGDNVWFKMFNNGTHADKNSKTKHVPISVTGGEYEQFYLSGMFLSDKNKGDKFFSDNAECYINGGRFGELASGGMEKIDGDIAFLIDNADIENFYGGGINPAMPVTGSISVTINDSHVGTYCGGPKFGDMVEEKTVITNAARTTFGTFFGAGYGGTAYNRVRTRNESNVADYGWNTWDNDYHRRYESGNKGISTSFETEFFAWAGGGTTANVGRFYVNFASLSLATTRNVTSTLTGCIIENNFYGGGNLGSVNGNITSTLTGCTVKGNVFGAGFSASVPTVDVFPEATDANWTVPSYNGTVGVYNEPTYPTPVTYTWSDTKGTLENNSSSCFVDDAEGHWIHTDVDLSGLGKVTGTVTLTIDGNTMVNGTAVKDAVVYGGSVFGGGEESNVDGSTNVNVQGTSNIAHNVYGGGYGTEEKTGAAAVSQNVTVNINGGSIGGDVYGGGAIASTNTSDSRNTGVGSTTYTTMVNLFGGIVGGDAYGGGQGKHFVASNYSSKYTTEQIASMGIEANCAAIVYGNVTVNLGDATHDATAFRLTTTTDDASNTIPTSGRVFGCNNINGTPKGTVLVNVAKTWGLNGEARKTYEGEEAANNKPTPLASHDAYSMDTPGNFELEAVYGGGNLAAYDPYSSTLTTTGQYDKNNNTYSTNHDATGRPLQVVINSCEDASIHYVYGGGNAASVPSTDVIILGALEIGTVFGGGNGKDKFQLPNSSTWNTNEGADVGILTKNSSGTVSKYYGAPSDAPTTKPSSPIGVATTSILGGTIHLAFGGSNTKGDIVTNTNVILGDENMQGCKLDVGTIYGAGNNAEMSGDIVIEMGCTEGMDKIFGGARDADINGSVTLNITGGHYNQVFGGNDHGGALKGSITVNIEERSCLPIEIGELYGGGNEAPYSVYGYATDENGAVIHDENHRPTLIETGTPLYADPQVNVISATSIGSVYGGGYGSTARMVGSPHVNINMKQGHIDGNYTYTLSTSDPRYDSGSSSYTYKNTSGTALVLNTEQDLPYGEIGSVYGGGDAANVVGDTYVDIGTGEWLNSDRQRQREVNDVIYTYEDNVWKYNDGEPKQTSTAPTSTRDYAYITGDVFGGGNEADISGNTNVTISGRTKGLSESADEAANTTQGTVYVAGSVYGGGNLGSVGTFTSGASAYDGTAKPTTCAANTGLCTVTINGYAEIGPDGMQMTATGGPDDHGHVFGASKGALPAADTDEAKAAVENATFVNATEVTIGGNAFVKGSVFGGSENGHVLHDTHVTIADNCQVGSGDDINRRYTETEWSSSTSLAECAHWPYDASHNGDSYDPFHETAGYDSNGGALTANDGRTFYGSVFGGGSGYYPYAPGKWLSSAGNVYGNATVDITGGHILTSVYGGNEMTDVGEFTFDDETGLTTIVGEGGHATVNMVGGTVGVPRTDAQMRAHPVTCYVFGAGKGDPRIFFNQFTNVASATVNITGTARIYGSTFGGGEDGHVVGHVVTNVGGTVKIDLNRDGDTDDEGETFTHSNVIIGTTGTSGVDGNIFGAGRGYSALALTIGLVQGNATTNITNGKIFGSVYGGGRTASVGTYQVLSNHRNYGKMLDCNGTDDPSTTDVDEHHNHGHIFVNISGNAEIGRINSSLANERGAVGGMLAQTNVDLAEGEKHPSIGDVFGGGKGLALHDNIDLSKKFGWVKNTTVKIFGNAKVNGSVYGGGEISSVGNPDEPEPTEGQNWKTGFSEVSVYGNATIGTLNNSFGEKGKGYVYGSSKGLAGSHYSEDAFVKNSVVTIGAENKDADPPTGVTAGYPHVYGSVFGGGEDGHVRKDAAVYIKGGTIGSPMVGYNEIDPVVAHRTTDYDEWYFNPNTGASNVTVYRGNVYAGGRGIDHDEDPDDGTATFSTTAGAVYGNASVTMTGGHVYHNIYGSGAMASVGTVTKTAGKPDYLNGTWTENTGHATILITGGMVGDDTSGHEGRNNGRVFGAGRGLAGNITTEEAQMEFVHSTEVTIGGDAQVLGAVYGGGENGHVKFDTEVNIGGNCVIGSPLSLSECQVSAAGAKGNAFRGNVFGGGRGVDATGDNSEHRSFTAGRVYGNTTVNVTGGLIYRAVYGGGMLASVGDPTRSADRTDPGTPLDDSDDYFTIAGWTFDPAHPNGVATVNVSGGYIGNVKANDTPLEGSGTTYGEPGRNNGAVFGSGAGFMATNGTSEQYSALAYVYRSYVNISDAPDTEGNKHTHIRAAVFGGGENGHVWENATVNVSGGTIGNSTDGTNGGDFAFAGNVFGSGRGMNVTVPDDDDIVSTTAGWVKGNTTVNIWGNPTICRDVYGGGNLGSVGNPTESSGSGAGYDKFGYKTGLATVNILGGGIYGNVYGGSRGTASAQSEYHDMSYVKNAIVNITGTATIHNDTHTDGDNGGFVYGGGNAGHIRRNTEVNIGGAKTVRACTGITPTGDSIYTTINAADGGTVGADVFGGGRGSEISETAGLVNHDVEVNILGGTIGGSVYGGGAIGNSNCHDQRNTDSETKAPSTEAKVNCTTVVNLIGGIIKGDAFGGGKGVIPADDASDAVKANSAAIVYGDVTVNLGKADKSDATAFVDRIYKENADGTVNQLGNGRVFGCNNLNGTPKGTVLVHVRRTWGSEKDENNKDIRKATDTKPTQKTHAAFTMSEPGTYDVGAVYGGGLLAAYDPYNPNATGQYNVTDVHDATGHPVQVVIENCDATSVRLVYGGGSAAPVPASDVLVLGAYEIGTVFGGGNGKNKYTLDGGTTYNPNPGADIGILDATAYAANHANGTYGTGNARTMLRGGFIHQAFGGSNTLGNIRGEMSVLTADGGDCKLDLGKLYGGGNAAASEGDVTLTLNCSGSGGRIEEVYGGAYGANINGNVTLNINGGNYGKVFGGNDHTGSISGKITVNIEKTDTSCDWNVDYVYGGGNQAPYTAPLATGSLTERIASPEVNVIKGRVNYAVFGGGLGATAIVTGNPVVNIGGVADGDVNLGFENNINNNGTVNDASDDFEELGTGNVYGGGNEANVVGSPTVNIGTGIMHPVTEDVEGVPTAVNKPRIYAYINNNVYGGGKGQLTDGDAALVSGNTTVMIQGNAMVYNRVFGGGEVSSVGTFTKTDGKPSSFTENTGLCTVTIQGNAQIGPIGQEMTKDGGPDDFGHVFGGGKGENNIALYPNVEKMTFVASTEVTIGGNALVTGAVYGGSENGHVLTNTHVTIADNCQIGLGEGKTAAYTESDWTAALEWTGSDETLPSNFTECSSWVYRQERPFTFDPYADPKDAVDVHGVALYTRKTDGKFYTLTGYTDNVYDLFHAKYETEVSRTESAKAYTEGRDAYGNIKFYDDLITGYPLYLKEGVTAEATDDDYYNSRGGASYGANGATFYGNVFGGGSGYYPYAPGQWLKTAGQVEGNTVVDITGGHILTSVYGGNELTDVKGNCTVNMSGGTLGVPRSSAAILAHPVTCNLFGAGKGDQRELFNTWTNVEGNTSVNVSGTARIFGSTFGGGEDGHVFGDATTNLSGSTIGSTGLSGADGNIFGGGRGFTATAYTAGVVKGNVFVNMSGGTLLGTVYGGGRLASVGSNLVDPEDTGYGLLIADTESVEHGHISITVSGGDIKGDVFGGGLGAETVNTGLDVTKFGLVKQTSVNISGTAVINHNVYGGGSLGVVGQQKIANTAEEATAHGVEVGYTYERTGGSTAISMSGGTVKGNIYGGGKGLGNSFLCEKGWVIDSTTVSIADGTVDGSVYGGGEVGRVETNSHVTIGAAGSGSPIIGGSVFGSGKGLVTHGYAGLLRGNTYITIQGNAQVRHNVYGGGELSSVGRFRIATQAMVNDPEWQAAHPDVNAGEPYALRTGGICTILVQGNAQIGPEAAMSMKANGGPDDYGHVFGGGKGVLPYMNDLPRRMNDSDDWDEFYTVENNAPVMPKVDSDLEKRYFNFIKSLGVTGRSEVTINGSALVKGSVYGGAENGRIISDTHVTIAGGQIGLGEGMTTAYTEANWTAALAWTGSDTTNTFYDTFKECSAWDYDENNPVVYDQFVKPTPYEGEYYYDDAHTQPSRGGGPVGKNGATFYGNVFGGGCGYYPYAPGKWMRSAGKVEGNTRVDILGGHILSCVYGGNEMTDVDSTCTVNMVGGTVGIPRSSAACQALPVTNVIYGGGKGDQRTFFNQWTNVDSTSVNISGTARIFGSVYGGGEDGHVLRNVATNIGDNITIGGTTYTAQPTLIIGSTGQSGVDGNVFGAGRGFTATAYTAGVVCGNVKLNISAGKVRGKVYGGGRLASVGGYLVQPELTDGTTPNPKYGKIIEDNAVEETETIMPETGTHGHITLNIRGGDIAGNVYGAGKGTDKDPVFGITKMIELNITGGTLRSKVYGGGEMGEVQKNTNVIIGNNSGEGPTILSDVFGAGSGDEKAGEDAAAVFHNVTVQIKGGRIEGDVYGGGEIANSNVHNTFNGGHASSTGVNSDGAHATYTTIDLTGGFIAGNVYGGGRGKKYDANSYTVAQKTAATAAGIDIEANCAAIVYGDVTITLGGTKAGGRTAGCTAFGKGFFTDNLGTPVQSKGRIIGANNINGTPKGTVLVHILRTHPVKEDTSGHYVACESNDPDAAEYDLGSVYGGGNLAVYDPHNPNATGQYTTNHTATKQPTQVVIDGCDYVSIRDVYGGGNAASTPSTDVLVLGAKQIGTIFGGGNGKDRITFSRGSTWLPNPGADVGVKGATHPAGKAVGGETYGTGIATTTILGGKIGNIFGGSNTLGDVITRVDLTVGDENIQTCTLNIDTLYGAGNQAVMTGDISMEAGCLEHIGALFGGANNADVHQDIELTVKGGDYGSVYGGNNHGGTIYGTITVNIDESGCLPVTIGSLYGGGNQADYSTKNIPDTTKTKLGAGYIDFPKVNVIAATRIDSIFGGANQAIIVGNPHVNINMKQGSVDGTYRFNDTKSFYKDTTAYVKTEYQGYDATNASSYSNADETSPRTFPFQLQLGNIGTVFGGGNNGDVEGSTYVHIGTGKDESGTVLTRQDAQIQGNVFGGGNNAIVTGNTNVVIGK